MGAWLCSRHSVPVWRAPSWARHRSSWWPPCRSCCSRRRSPGSSRLPDRPRGCAPTPRARRRAPRRWAATAAPRRAARSPVRSGAASRCRGAAAAPSACASGCPCCCGAGRRRSRSRRRPGCRGAAVSRVRHGDRGQASVELLGAVPALLLVALVVFQLLAVGYAKVLAGDAAGGGRARAAGGGDAASAATRALPGWSKAGTARPRSGRSGAGAPACSVAAARPRAAACGRGHRGRERTMTSWPEARGRDGGVLAAALARAEAWLLEPPTPRVPRGRPIVPPGAAGGRVRGLARGCGASTVARALAVAFARWRPSGSGRGGGRARAGRTPARGTRSGAAGAEPGRRVGFDGARATGRVCLLGDDEPVAALVDALPCAVVIDVAHGSPPAEGLGHADVAVWWRRLDVDTALVVAVEASLATAGAPRGGRRQPGRPARAWRPGRGLCSGAVAIGESRLAAQLALGCREARGPLASPIAELAERCRTATARR